MARVLIVGAPERAAELEASGHVIDAGADVDPDRLATVTPRLESVSVVCWLLGEDGSPALHGDRLASLLEYVVDTPVRAFVYERSERHPGGQALVARASETFRLRTAVIAPGDDLAAAVDGALAG